MTFAGLIHCAALTVGIAFAAPADDAGRAAGPSEALALARKVLPPNMPARESEHFVLLTDADLVSADAVLETLEAAYQAVQRSCGSIGLRPAPLPNKLVSILFRSRDDFIAFNKRVKPDMREWAVGYYDQITDRLVMFDLVTQPDVQGLLRSVRRNLSQFERDVVMSGVSPAQTGAPGNQVAQARSQLDRDEQRVKADARNALASTIAHEAAHGLLFDTGVQRRAVPYPFWLSEGLATNFEPTFARDRDFGFQRENPMRRPVFEEGLRTNQCVPLETLVLCDAAPAEDSRGEVGRLYAQACFLTKWLARERPTELRRYIESLQDGSWSDRDNRRARFEAIFGPIDSLERSWMRSEARTWSGLMATDMGAKLREFDRVALGVPKATAAPQLAPNSEAKPEPTPEAKGPAAPASAPGR